MKFSVFLAAMLFFSIHLFAQETYTMGYEKIDLEVIDPHFFSEYQMSGQPSLCGVYDQESATFYTCDYQTFRYVDEDLIEMTGKDCCKTLDFDPKRYYGTLTLQGVIDSVEWDNLIIHFTTDKARLVIKTDEREIDALYDKFYKKVRLGDLHIKLRFKTYDTPKEDVLSYNKNTEIKVKPKRHLIRVLRW